MNRILATILCLALAPFAWAGDDEDKQAEKDLKALRDRIMKRVTEQLDKEFDRIRAEVKTLIDQELGTGDEKKEPKAEPKEEPKEEKHPKKQPKDDGPEKTDPKEKKPGYMGVQLGADLEGHASVQGVFPDSPAEEAGLKEGDIFVKIGGKEIDTVQSLIEAVQAAGAGSTLKFTVRRGADEIEVKVKLAARPEEPGEEPPDEKDGGDEK